MKDYSVALLGAICGDIIGSPYESRRVRNKKLGASLFTDRSRFTDDTVMTVAVADWIMTGGKLSSVMQDWGSVRYPRAGYGGMFRRWLYAADPEPYNSFGNGSAMRVSAVGWAFDTLEETLEKAKESAEVTHNHPEGIKGAQAVAAAIFLGRTGHSKDEIKAYVQDTFGYDLDRKCDEIRPGYGFDVTCQGSVPESIIAFLESTDYESAIRLAVELGGDTDTMGAIAGSIAAAFYGEIPVHIKNECLNRLPADIRTAVYDFNQWLSEREK